MSDVARPKSSGDKLSSDEVNRDLPVLMTAGEAIATPLAVYIKDSDGKVYKTDANFDDERIHNFVGFAMDAAGGDGSPIAIQTHGVAGSHSGLDAGKVYYLSDTSGEIGTPTGTYEKMVGIAVSATEVWIAPWAYRGLTQKAQTITGVKTFGSIPIGPTATPTADNELTRKAYVDTKVGAMASGTFTKALDDASTSQNIAHGLGRTPKYVRFTGLMTGVMVQSIGVSDGVSHSVVFRNANGSIAVRSSSYAIFYQVDASEQKATVALNATNIVLTWTKNSSPTGSLQIMWEAFA